MFKRVLLLSSDSITQDGHKTNIQEALTCVIVRPSMQGLKFSHIGGMKSAISNFPYLVQIEVDANNDWRFACDGAIYSKDTVITAAGCLESVRDPDEGFKLRVLAGQTKSKHTEGASAIHDVGDVIIHPGYNASINGIDDIGLIEVTPPFEFGKNIQSIAIVGKQPEVGEMGVGAGWASLGFRPEIAETVRSIDVKIIEHAICERKYKNKYESKLKARGFKITDAVLCASFPNSRPHHLDACVEENGGPLAINNKLAGLATVDLSCFEKDPLPGLYTNIFYYTDWIESSAGKWADSA